MIEQTTNGGAGSRFDAAVGPFFLVSKLLVELRDIPHEIQTDDLGKASFHPGGRAGPPR